MAQREPEFGLAAGQLLGILLLIAILPACGGESEGAPGSGGQGGTVSADGSADGGGQDAPDGGLCAACKPWDVGGLLYLGACCQDIGVCGVTDSTDVAPAGCHGVEQPGPPDPTCPSIAAKSYDGGVATYEGCCRAGTATCGVLVDLSAFMYPRHGCIGTGPASAQPCGGSCAACRKSECATEVKACLNNSACASLWSCVAACTTQSCSDECVWSSGYSYPPGYENLAVCFEQKCKAACG